jgi:hypothetical protein
MNRRVIRGGLGRVAAPTVAGELVVDTGAAFVVGWIVAARSAAEDDRDTASVAPPHPSR